MMIPILLVEDDPVLGRGLSVSLELEGYKALWAPDLKSAYDFYKNEKCDLVLLDRNLPDGNGLEFLQHIRKEGSNTPVIFLTAKTDEDSVVEGLQHGANDYIRKPFGNRELLARVKAVLREPRGIDSQIRYGDLIVFPERRKVFSGEKEVELNRREFDVLRYFIQNAEKVVTREALLTALDQDGEIFDRTIDSHISHVRARLRNAEIRDVLIQSVYGVGYRLERMK